MRNIPNLTCTQLPIHILCRLFVNIQLFTIHAVLLHARSSMHMAHTIISVLNIACSPSPPHLVADAEANASSPVYYFNGGEAADISGTLPRKPHSKSSVSYIQLKLKYTKTMLGEHEVQIPPLPPPFDSLSKRILVQDDNPLPPAYFTECPLETFPKCTESVTLVSIPPIKVCTSVQ